MFNKLKQRIKEFKRMWNKGPTLYTLKSLQATLNSDVQTGLSNGQWVPSRPRPYYSFKLRCKNAWMVFIGRADPFVWPEDQHK